MDSYINPFSSDLCLALLVAMYNPMQNARCMLSHEYPPNTTFVLYSVLYLYVNIVLVDDCAIHCVKVRRFVGVLGFWQLLIGHKDVIAYTVQC